MWIPFILLEWLGNGIFLLFDLLGKVGGFLLDVIFTPIDFVLRRPWLRRTFVITFWVFMNVILGFMAVAATISAFYPPEQYPPAEAWIIYGVVFDFMFGVCLMCTARVLWPRRRRQQPPPLRY
jgi:hypothetical protein